MKQYHHLTQRERYLIEHHLSSGKKQKEIAEILGCSPSTISRELKRNKHISYCGKESYDYLYADYLARMKRDNKPKRTAFTKKVKEYVIKCLKKQHSPEQISGRIYQEIGENISIETIYRFVYQDKAAGGNLYINLRWQNRKRKRRLHNRNKQRQYGNIPRKSIHDRDNIVESKSRFGDLEIDTIIGKNHKQAILTIVDRKTKYLWMQKLIYKRSENVAKASNKILASIAKYIHTITADNGSEFATYEEIEKKLGINFYFCDPYSSWQRGLNEHTNGLIRQYLPKKTDFTKVDYKTIKMIQNRLNNRPRKSLDFKTPKEALLEAIA
jgi:IS30 family transposase